LIGCLAVVFLGTIIALCGSNSLACVAVLTSDGAVSLAWLAGATALGALILRPFFGDDAWATGELSGSLAAEAASPVGGGVGRCFFVASAGGLGLGIFSLAALGLGLAGWLNRPVAIGFPVVSAVLFAIDLIRRHPEPVDRNAIERWLREPAGAGWLWLVPVVSLAMAGVAGSILPGILWKPLDPHPYDVTSYHLQVPREWYEGGRIVPLDHNVFSYFPFNVEMQFLLLMHAMGGPWEGMYACQFISAGYAVLMVLGVAGGAGARERVSAGSSKVSFASIIGGGFAAIVPWTIMLAGVAYVESGLMLYTALSVGWALEAVRRPGRMGRSLALSGVMAGFACGVKITAVPMLLMAVPVAVGVVLVGRGGVNWKKLVVHCGGIVLIGSVVLSPWLIRNFVWSGNPLFPIGMRELGRDHFSDQQVERFRVAHSATAVERTAAGKLRVLRNDVIENWQYGFLFFPLVLVGVAGGWRDSQSWVLVICGVFVVGVWVGFTHLLPRFLVMVIPIGGMLIGRIRWGWAWPVGVVVLVGTAVCGWSYVAFELMKQSDPPPMYGQQQAALFGPDMSMLLAESPELVHARDEGRQIGLVGDAQAYLYEIPMSQLHYRTVFNVRGDDAIDGWAGPEARGNRNWLLVINPMEIDRLHRTYVGVPGLLPGWGERAPETFYLRGDQVAK
jgi:hypothetical protein